MINLNRIFKSRDITLQTKFHLVKAMIFPVVMNGREKWTIKKTEWWRIDTFELWCWRRLWIVVLKSPLDYKEIKSVNPKGNQPWILIGRTVAEADAPILWPPDVKSQLTGKDRSAGKDWRHEKKKAAEDELVNSIINSINMNLNKLPKIVANKGGWHAIIHGVARSRTWLNDWTITIITTTTTTTT